MFIFLSKFLPPYLYPLGLGCLLVGLGLFLHHRPKARQLVLGLALLVLWAGGSRWVSMSLARGLEWRYLPSGGLPNAEAIVVLGGGTQSAEWPRPMVEVNYAGDRILYAAELYHQGKAPYLLLSGGGIEWLGEADTSAEDMAALLERLGVPPEALWLESESRNTYENALYSQEILAAKGVKRILLVTSALHMPRSVALYRHQGLEVIPAPTDFTVTQPGWERLWAPNLAGQAVNLAPSAEELAVTSRALKEYLGLLVYRLRGWL